MRPRPPRGCGPRHARDPARTRPAARLHGRVGRPRRLGGAEGGALPRLVGGVHARRRPHPLRLLGAGRARAPRPGRQHQLRARGLPALRAPARATAPARDGDRGHPARRGRLVQPLPARGRHLRRALPRRRRSRSPAGGRGVREVRARAACPRAPARGPRRRRRRPDRVSGEPFALPRPSPEAPTRRSPPTPLSSPTAPLARPGSARSLGDRGGSPRATAATTASTARCSPTGSWRCTRPAR